MRSSDAPNPDRYKNLDVDSACRTEVILRSVQRRSSSAPLLDQCDTVYLSLAAGMSEAVITIGITDIGVMYTF